MKSILISIKPEHCYNITNKNKIMEIRTTCPMEWKKYLDGKTNIKPKPCKVYIYETKAKWFKPYHNSYINKTLYEEYEGRGKIITEFILNEIDKIEICDPYIFRNNEQEDWKYFEKKACLTCEQIMEYIGYGENHDGWDKKYAVGYAWHIDDLIIYDTPKELSEFDRPEIDLASEDCRYGVTCPMYKYKKIKRPPQSWCYVEEEGE